MDPSDNNNNNATKPAPSLDPESPVKSAPSNGDTRSQPSIAGVAVPQELIDYSLNFLSTSSNERLLGVFAALALATYIILGRIGLLLIGVAVGVILHASWEGPDLDAKGEGSRARKSSKRKELALELSNRLLDWQARNIPAEAENEKAAPLNALEDLSSLDLEYSTFQPATGAALRALTDAVIKDYVKYWYEPILPSESTFPLSCRRILTHFITSISSHVSRKRTEDTFLQFLTNSSSIIIVFLNELAAAFAAVPSASMEAEKVVEHYLMQSPDSSLANILSGQQQRKKLNMIADDILSSYLESKSYSCSSVRDFCREVFAGLVLESTVISMARPEFINGWIIYLLEDGESEIMHAIDAGVEGARNQGVSAPLSNPTLDSTPKSTENRRSQVNKDTEEAMFEAKRLSALMASQDTHIVDPAERPPEVNQPLEISTLGADNPQESVAGTVKSDGGVNASQPTSPSLPHLTLHGALVLVDYSSTANDKGTIKSRPSGDYMLQVEPASSGSTGWMVFRKYSDFQSLHEMLETVSRLNRIQAFSERYPTLPHWKGKTRQGLARELEKYLQDALKHESLAETDRIRRFLERDGGSGSEAASAAKPGFSFPNQTAFENMGKGVLGALTNAPKGVAGGGKAVFDGVTGVFGGVAGNSRKPASTTAPSSSHLPSLSKTDSEPLSVTGSTSGPSRAASYDADRQSSDRPMSMLSSEPGGSPALVPSPSDSSFEFTKAESSRDLSAGEITDDAKQTMNQSDVQASASTLAHSDGRISLDSTSRPSGLDPKESTEISSSVSGPAPEHGEPAATATQGTRKQGSPITADETQIAVELIFAVINELYTLSSAWNIRRTLLNAAKSYILRPGSPTLETIRTLLQDSMIEAHTSDEALGEYLTKLRENALPTEEELGAWPPPPSEEEKAELREKARKLFVQRGIPQALTSVMGAAASREALEKIFDSLQVDTVARGFVFSIMLQGLRVLAL
ncbi:hypothetical protein N7474_007065 [Penicillium riverlandense]|uniref:uncharacterized protein n=1 Tax=Penicillium riverlandense TaxID=1903569 RepID=UPI002546DDFB|nr:uncharacterized protein N7474_007065 [Penicillium riverlandense]KAJ5815288.1 hypothetical protein N7474_007065 [Penicillium riverlandense]